MTIDPNLKDDDYILITNDNLSKFGFACFHQKRDNKTEDGFWVREVEINVGGEQGNIIQKFKVPEELCIELSPRKKIVDSDRFEIRGSYDSNETIFLLLQRAGWNQSGEDLDSMITHGQGGVFIASYNFKNQNILLGSGVSFPVSDDHCWIGMILVHSELRRQGIARSIMNACLEYARLVQSKSIIGLDATPLGKQVYDSLGFKDSFTIWRSIIHTDVENTSSADIKLEPLNLRNVKNYLENKDYTARWKIIEVLNEIPDSKNIMLKTGDEIKGFVLSRPGRLKPFIGPLIADSHGVAILLLKQVLNHWKDLGHENILMDIPAHHLVDSIFFDEENLTPSFNHQIPVKPIRSFIRMYQLVSDSELIESSSDPAMKKALNCHDETAAFMKKEKQEIVPIMFGTSGPEWG